MASSGYISGMSCLRLQGFYLVMLFDVAAITLFNSCKSTDVPPDPVASVQMTAVPYTIRVGQTTSMSATPITSQVVAVQGIPCVFSSSDNSILSLTQSGFEAAGFGKKVGTAKVTAICGPVQNSITITVRPRLVTFVVNNSGTGNGIVLLNPAGGSYDSGTSVTATATPYLGSTFDGWGSACIGIGSQAPCTLLLATNQVATATFTQLPCTSYTYLAWSLCQPDSTQSRTVDSSSPPGCSGTPLLTQSCVYTPPITDCCECNFDVSCTVLGPGGCWYCRNSTEVSGICQAPMGNLTRTGRCVCDPFTEVCL